jgi:hypothetical protein
LIFLGDQLGLDRKQQSFYTVFFRDHSPDSSQSSR